MDSEAATATPREYPGDAAGNRDSKIYTFEAPAEIQALVIDRAIQRACTFK